MENISGRNHFTRQKPEAVSSHNVLEGIKLILSRWNGLQMAVQNQWGGCDSLQKSYQLAADIVSWFSQSKGPLYVEDLETLLHERMLLSFNTEIEDGSIEEVEFFISCELLYISGFTFMGFLQIYYCVLQC
ncbi:hypothetical protein LWI29_031797 [Acer saccharum]|uniref:Pre-rRNA-processing protein TSR2 homolog n=1 Tax=Acer saccharum TaxID=4024 RepID=A0AA39TJ56_ACESA|nr:hypothetical protein LWI29_031797 [Acer saccharum]